MLIGNHLRQRLILLFGVLLTSGFLQVWAQEEQEESKDVKQYREDYDRYQKAIAIQDSMKRADVLFQFMKDRPDSKVIDHAQMGYLLVVESLAKAEKYPVVITQCERLIKLRPHSGETYYFYGAALKNVGRVPEGMNALAKCTLIKNPAARKAQEFLEFVYKSQNQGSLIGLEKLKKAAQEDLNKQP
jgi:tetratricopeptide (TPR) repeat protein